MLLDDRVLVERAGKIEALLAEIESFPDPALRDKTADIVQGLLLLYGAGLAHIVGIIQEAPDSGAILAALAGDDLVSHLLLLHDLHPEPVEERVARALEEVRPYLKSHGGNVELLSVAGSVARVRLQGSCHGCPSSTITLRLAIEDAVLRAAPDIERVEAQGADETRPATFIPLSSLSTTSGTGPERRWATIDRPPLADGESHVLQVEGIAILFCRVGDTLYAYRDSCPACDSSLLGAGTDGDTVICPHCAGRFDARRAGRSVSSPDVHLHPIPLLAAGERIRVALTNEGHGGMR